MDAASILLENYVETLSFHLCPHKSELLGLVLLLQYLDGKAPTPRRLGAFSFAVTGLSAENMYGINGREAHFVANNRGYGATYLAFGGPPNAKAYGLRSGPPLRSIITGAAKAPPTTFSAQIIRQYGSAAPFYNIPLPVGHDFDIPEVDAMHEAYVSAGVGVRMGHDRSGLVTEKRLSEILSYVEDVYDKVPWLGAHIHILKEFIEVSYVTSCDLELLQRVASVVSESGHEELLGLIEEYGNYFRLFMVPDEMFYQIMAIPAKPSFCFFGVERRRPFVQELLANPTAPQTRAIESNRERIHKTVNQVVGWPVERGKYGDDSMRTFTLFRGTEEHLLELSPVDLIVKFDPTLRKVVIASVNDYPPSADTRTERFYPTDTIDHLIKAVVKPQYSLFHCDESEVPSWIPNRDIFHTLNSKTLEVVS